MPLHPLAAEWGVDFRTIRRLAVEAIVTSTLVVGVDSLVQQGRGKAARLVWQGDRVLRPGRTPPLVAAMAPWQALGVVEVSGPLELLLSAASRASSAEERERARAFREQGFWYQPWPLRTNRDPEAPNEVITAVYRHHPLKVGAYHRPEGHVVSVTLLPWTLVRSWDGLYVLGPSDLHDEPRIWAVHRMERLVRDHRHPFEVPISYRPADYLGHGYGPFVGTPGHTTLIVPAEEVPWVLEGRLPSQVGEPVILRDGSVQIVLDTVPHPGVWMWARANGVQILEED